MELLCYWNVSTWTLPSSSSSSSRDGGFSRVDVKVTLSSLIYLHTFDVAQVLAGQISLGWSRLVRLTESRGGWCFLHLLSNVQLKACGPNKRSGRHLVGRMRLVMLSWRIKDCLFPEDLLSSSLWELFSYLKALVLLFHIIVWSWLGC